jgi:hypothetical protein
MFWKHFYILDLGHDVIEGIDWICGDLVGCDVLQGLVICRQSLWHYFAVTGDDDVNKLLVIRTVNQLANVEQNNCYHFVMQLYLSGEKENIGNDQSP